jgi:hypothetical protein
MPLQPGGKSPYTTPTAVTTIINGYRDRGLGTPVTQQVLIRAGVPESLARRTMQALRLLELVDENGTPTPQLEAFRQARGEDDFQVCGQEWLRGVYADVLQYADPSTATPTKLTEAFRGYDPNGQRSRMAVLLLGLWEFVGLPVPEAARSESRSRPRPSGPSKLRASRPSAPSRAAKSTPRVATEFGDLPPGLVGLLRQIPRNGGAWTQERRDQFMDAFAVVLDFSVPIGIEDRDSATAEDANVGVDSS